MQKRLTILVPWPELVNRLVGQKHHDNGLGRKCGLRLVCGALGFRQAREDRSLFRMRRNPLTTSSLFSMARYVFILTKLVNHWYLVSPLGVFNWRLLMVL